MMFINTHDLYRLEYSIAETIINENYLKYVLKM